MRSPKITVTCLVLSTLIVSASLATQAAQSSPESSQVEATSATDTAPAATPTTDTAPVATPATNTASVATPATDTASVATPPTGTTPIAAARVSKTVMLREGTEVQLEFAEDISSKTATEDDKVNFRLAEDLKVGDIVVATAGSMAVGTVTNAKKAGMMGKGGELNVRLEYLKIGDVRVRLRANKGKEGANKVGATVALTVLFGPIGLLKRGHNIDIKEGTSLAAWVEQDAAVTIEEAPK